MRHKELIYLEDILMAIKEIESFIKKDKRFETYQKSTLLKRAIERNLEIIGEATRRLKRMNPTIKIENSKKIIDLRNIITHDYAAVKDDMIWAIVINHLPKLKSEAETLIKQHE